MEKRKEPKLVKEGSIVYAMGKYAYKKSIIRLENDPSSKILDHGKKLPESIKALQDKVSKSDMDNSAMIISKLEALLKEPNSNQNIIIVIKHVYR